MKKGAFVVLVFVSLFTLTSCELFSMFRKRTIDKVLLSGQKSIYMNASGSSRAVSSDGWLNNVISTIDERNNVHELMLGNGKKTFSQDSFELTPIAVSDYGKDFFTIRFDPYPAIYLVSKTNGNALCLNMVGNNDSNYSMGVWDVWYDGDDSIYLRTAHLKGGDWQWLEVRKGSLSSGKIKAISPSNRTVCNYGVDSNGLVLCILGPSDETILGYGYCKFSDVIEVYPNGGTKTYSLSGEYHGSSMFADSNSTFWLSTYDTMAKLKKENGNYSIEEFSNPGGQIVFPRFFGNNVYYRSNGFVGGVPDMGEPRFIESKEPREIHWFDCDAGVDHVLDLGGFLAIQIEKEGDFLYALGKVDEESVILKIDPRDNSYEKILGSDIFEIKTMTISDIEGMMFEGTRLDTGETVVGYRDEGTGYLQEIVRYQTEIQGLTKIK